MQILFSNPQHHISFFLAYFLYLYLLFSIFPFDAFLILVVCVRECPLYYFYPNNSSFLLRIASTAAHAGQSQYFAPAALISLPCSATPLAFSGPPNTFAPASDSANADQSINWNNIFFHLSDEFLGLFSSFTPDSR